MKIALIVNPNCGRKEARKLLPKVIQKLNHSNIEFDTFISNYHGHISQICCQLKPDQYDAVVSLGGDGTNFHVLNGLFTHFEHKDIPPLGIIPVAV